ncbi:MAG TPA: hypothetical protein VEK07_08480 [Polyangiaceae bacterium]|nr:hypothetical protein [Polyangiaceae bacterium]
MRPIALALVAFGGGVAGSLLSSGAVKQAFAEGSAITIPVPSEGVIFRSSAGHVVARLRSDPGGGVFELFDARGRVGVRLRAADGVGGVQLGRSAGAGAATDSSTPAGLPSTDDSGY